MTKQFLSHNKIKLTIGRWVSYGDPMRDFGRKVILAVLWRSFGYLKLFHNSKYNPSNSHSYPSFTQQWDLGSSFLEASIKKGREEIAWDLQKSQELEEIYKTKTERDMGGFQSKRMEYARNREESGTLGEEIEFPRGVDCKR